VINALEGQGIGVAGAEFDADADSFQIVLEAGGRVSPTGVGGGTIKDEDPDTSGVGGGTIKQAEE
jgi:hypothetical protein